MSKTKYISVADTAKLVRETIKIEFPGIKFSVRSKSYSGGASITIRWTDGPIARQVEDTIEIYKGASFDGMIDLKSPVTVHTEAGEKIHYGADFIFCERSYTPEFTQAVAEKLAAFYQVETPEMNDNGWYNYGDYAPLCDHNWDTITDKIRRVREHTRMVDGQLEIVTGGWFHSMSDNEAETYTHAFAGTSKMAICQRHKEWRVAHGLPEVPEQEAKPVLPEPEEEDKGKVETISLIGSVSLLTGKEYNPETGKYDIPQEDNTGFIMASLASLNIEDMTPLEAMNILSGLIDQAKKA